MRRNWIGAAIVVLVVVMPTLAVADKVAVDYASTTDFSGYRTFAWREGMDARRLAAQKAIEESVARELAARGVRHTEEAADLYVSTYAIADTHTIDELADETKWQFWSTTDDIDAYQLQAGTLVVDLMDAKTGDRVWRGLANGPVKGPVEKTMRKVDKLIQKMFEELPIAAP